MPRRECCKMDELQVVAQRCTVLRWPQELERGKVTERTGENFEPIERGQNCANH